MGVNFKVEGHPLGSHNGCKIHISLFEHFLNLKLSNLSQGNKGDIESWEASKLKERRRGKRRKERNQGSFPTSEGRPTRGSSKGCTPRVGPTFVPMC